MAHSQDDDAPDCLDCDYCMICGTSCCGINGLGQCNGSYEGRCHLAWEQEYGLEPNEDVGEALERMAKNRAYQLRIRVTSMRDDGNRGHPSGMAKAFPKITKMLQDGARAGVLEMDLSEQGAEDRLPVVIDFDLFPTRPYDPEQLGDEGSPEEAR